MRAQLNAPITEVEVEGAINQCKRNKASGPDLLGNDWYKDFQSDLVPILVVHFQAYQREAKVPRSFTEAITYLVWKPGDANDPMNFRLLALLNTEQRL